MPPPCQPFGLPFDPPGAPLRGSPGHSGRLPLPFLFGNGEGWASEARRALARRGVGKNQSGGADRGRRPPAVEMWGRWGSRWAGVGAAGGQPPGCPRGVPAPVHGPAKPPTGRAAISTFPPPGVQLGPLWGPVVRSAAALGLSVLGQQRLQPEKCPVVLARQR